MQNGKDKDSGAARQLLVRPVRAQGFWEAVVPGAGLEGRQELELQGEARSQAACSRPISDPGVVTGGCQREPTADGSCTHCAGVETEA